MPVADLMINGLKLLGLGMGTVFVFLGLLILAMKLMSRIAQSIGDGAAVSDQMLATPLPSAQTSPIQEDAAIPAVIAAALHRYRATHRRLGH